MDLSIAKVDSPDPVVQGSSLTYTVTVTNNGPSNATGVVMTDTLPAGVTVQHGGGGARSRAIKRAASSTARWQSQRWRIDNGQYHRDADGEWHDSRIRQRPARTKQNRIDQQHGNANDDGQPGRRTICVLSFNDLNSDGDWDAGEGLLSGATISVTNSLGQVVGTRTTNGTEPFCFSNLPAGLYTIIEVNPAGYSSTSPDLITANVVTGGSVLGTFGNVQFTPTPTATSTPTATATFTPTPTQTPTNTPTPICAMTAIYTTTNVIQPKGIAVDAGTGRVYVANFNTSSVTVINDATGALLSMFSTGGTHANQLALNPVTNKLYVTNRDSDNVSVLNPVNGALLAQIPVGSHPFGIAVNPNTNRIYVANFDSGTVSIIDGNTNTVIDTVNVGTLPAFITIDPLTNRVYVSVFASGQVAVLDGATNVVIANIATGSDPFGIAVNPYTQRLYVTTRDVFAVRVFDTQTLANVATVPLANEPFMVAVNTNANTFLVTTLDNRLTKFSGGTNAILDIKTLGAQPTDGLAVNPVTNRVYVANNSLNSVTAFSDACVATATPTVAGPTSTFTPTPSQTEATRRLRRRHRKHQRQHQHQRSRQAGSACWCIVTRTATRRATSAKRSCRARRSASRT